MFDAKVLIKRLPSFSVPKITVIQHVKPILKLQSRGCSKRGKPEQSYETRNVFKKDNASGVQMAIIFM